MPSSYLQSQRLSCYNLLYNVKCSEFNVVGGFFTAIVGTSTFKFTLRQVAGNEKICGS